MDMKLRHIVWLLAAVLAASDTRADSPAPKEDPGPARIAAAARQAWAITDLVLEKDIDPPVRQQMLLEGVKALLRRPQTRSINNLSGRISALTTPEQFAAVLAEAWPKDVTPDVNGDGPEETLFRGLFGGRSEENRHGAYLTPRDVKIYEVRTGNRYVGTGIQIRIDQKEKLAQIVVPFPGGPARKAGALPGDLITAVDDQDMKGQSIREYVRRLQGEEGTEVSMTVRQPGESKTRRLPMIRGVVPFSSVHGYRRTGEESWSFLVDPKSEVGYLSLDDIHSSTLLELRQIESMLREQGVRALVLDLRFSMGEEMRHASLVADGLLDGGLLWRVRDAHGKTREYKADRDCLFRDMPMAVLVGPHTHGMAELLAAALQDRERAVVVGEPTRGGLFERSLVPLAEGHGALLLRSGKVERIARTNKTALERRDDDRIVPDHAVTLERKESEAILTWRQEQNSPEPKSDARPPADTQLSKAVTLLREALTKRETKGAE
jgi:carboxyl-terminal processing protease